MQLTLLDLASALNASQTSPVPPLDGLPTQPLDLSQWYRVPVHGSYSFALLQYAPEEIPARVLRPGEQSQPPRHGLLVQCYHPRLYEYFVRGLVHPKPLCLSSLLNWTGSVAVTLHPSAWSHPPLCIRDAAWTLSFHRIHETLTATAVELEVLGGAYSTLGRTSQAHARTARRLALRQIHLARLLQDRTLEARYWAYFAEGCIQLGELSLAHAILNRQYRILSTHDATSTVLVTVQSTLTKLAVASRHGRKEEGA
ncbi:MAG: hypothetical protein DHS80DRAFT_29538 [Piptocephalis tieghemiana]|nr:MAG: hypothetical protein DHS80DRAFT_29538 [Piptocephalis tieghemiana]